MKKTINILIAIIIISAIYYCYDKLFEIYSFRNIIFGFIAIVMVTMLYFSLRLCFVKRK